MLGPRTVLCLWAWSIWSLSRSSECSAVLVNVEQNVAELAAHNHKIDTPGFMHAFGYTRLPEQHEVPPRQVERLRALIAKHFAGAVKVPLRDKFRVSIPYSTGSGSYEKEGKDFLQSTKHVPEHMKKRLDALLSPGHKSPFMLASEVPQSSRSGGAEEASTGVRTADTADTADTASTPTSASTPSSIPTENESEATSTSTYRDQLAKTLLSWDDRSVDAPVQRELHRRLKRVADEEEKLSLEFAKAERTVHAVRLVGLTTDKYQDKHVDRLAGFMHGMPIKPEVEVEMPKKSIWNRMGVKRLLRPSLTTKDKLPLTRFYASPPDTPPRSPRTSTHSDPDAFFSPGWSSSPGHAGLPASDALDHAISADPQRSFADAAASRGVPRLELPTRKTSGMPDTNPGAATRDARSVDDQPFSIGPGRTGASSRSSPSPRQPPTGKSPVTASRGHGATADEGSEAARKTSLAADTGLQTSDASQPSDPSPRLGDASAISSASRRLDGFANVPRPAATDQDGRAGPDAPSADFPQITVRQRVQALEAALKAQGDQPSSRRGARADTPVVGKSGLKAMTTSPTVPYSVLHDPSSVGTAVPHSMTPSSGHAFPGSKASPRQSFQQATEAPAKPRNPSVDENRQRDQELRDAKGKAVMEGPAPPAQPGSIAVTPPRVLSIGVGRSRNVPGAAPQQASAQRDVGSNDAADHLKQADASDPDAGSRRVASEDELKELDSFLELHSLDHGQQPDTEPRGRTSRSFWPFSKLRQLLSLRRGRGERTASASMPASADSSPRSSTQYFSARHQALPVDSSGDKNDPASQSSVHRNR